MILSLFQPDVVLNGLTSSTLPYLWAVRIRAFAHFFSLSTAISERYPGKDFGNDRNRSSVTTTMVVDNTAYISTSLKGIGSYVYDPRPKDHREDTKMSIRDPDDVCKRPVLDGLVRCQEKSIDVKTRKQVNKQVHQYQAKCGKLFLTDTWCLYKTDLQ